MLRLSLLGTRVLHACECARTFFRLSLKLLVKLVIYYMSASKRLSLERSLTLLLCPPLPALVPRETLAPRVSSCGRGLACVTHRVGTVEQLAIARVIHSAFRRQARASHTHPASVACNPETEADQAVASQGYCAFAHRELSVSSFHLGVHGAHSAEAWKRSNGVNSILCCRLQRLMPCFLAWYLMVNRHLSTIYFSSVLIDRSARIVEPKSFCSCLRSFRARHTNAASRGTPHNDVPDPACAIPREAPVLR